MNTNRMSGKTIVVLCVKERLNLTQVTNLQNYFSPLVNQTHTNIILDLRYVRFMDCCAIGCIISLSEKARANHNTFTLCNLNKNVRLLANIMKLSDIIPINNARKYHINQHKLDNAANHTPYVKYNPLFQNI